MLAISLPSYLRGDAILTTTHLINRMPSRILHLQTPLDCLKKSYPSTCLVSEIPSLNLKKYSVSQRIYTVDLLTKIGMLGCRPADTPIEFNCKLGNSDDQVPVDKEQYQRLVGKLIYLSHTRPNISFAVNVVSQFMQAPYEKHMEAVNKILRYLKTTPGKGLVFRKTDRKTIEAYTDADWARCVDKKSTSGYCNFV